MHIAFNGWFWEQPTTGSGQYIRRLVAALHEVAPALRLSVLTPDFAASDEDVAGIEIIPLSARRDALGKLWWEQVTMPRAARRLGVDLFHAPYWAGPWATPAPTVVTIHDIIPLILPAYRGSALVRAYTALVRRTAGRAAHILTDSAASRRDILRHLPVAGPDVTSVPLAADASYVPASSAHAPRDADERIWRALGVRPGYVLYLGGFDVRKNLAGVMAAFARTRVEEARLVIAGALPTADTAFTPDPRRLAREADLPEDAVHFVGFVPEAQKPALYRGARVFLFPSRYEGFGLPPLEALACGVPVVGSDAASLPEVVGPAGLLTAPDDIPGLAAGLARFLTDEAMLLDYRRRAVAQAATFSWSKTARATLACYRRVVGE
ncbi:MAG: glycosyltransferase family 4 protein [Anaerolineales bacterium]